MSERKLNSTTHKRKGKEAASDREGVRQLERLRHRQTELGRAKCCSLGGMRVLAIEKMVSCNSRVKHHFYALDSPQAVRFASILIRSLQRALRHELGPSCSFQLLMYRPQAQHAALPASDDLTQLTCFLKLFCGHFEEPTWNVAAHTLCTAHRTRTTTMFPRWAHAWRCPRPCVQGRVGVAALDCALLLRASLT